ncbi:hypothetical protein BD311DRAFT_604550, partial [Dichomitus squalens]
QQTRSGASFSPWATVAPFGTPIEAPSDFDLCARIEAALVEQKREADWHEEDDLPLTQALETD